MKAFSSLQIAASILLLSSLVAAMATTKTKSSSSRVMHNRRQQSYDTAIIKSLHSKSKQSSSRRGFISSCTAAVAVSVLATPLSSHAMPLPTQTSDVKNDLQSYSYYNTSPTNLDTHLIASTQLQEKITPPTLTAFQESISGFISGTAVSTIKTLVKYPLDTATVRLQMPNTDYTIRNLPMLFSGSFDGIVAPLLSNIPAGAVFFAVKDATKTALKESGIPLPKLALTSAAVAVAIPPYWLLRNPSEVVKTRIQVRAEGYYEGMSTIDAFKVALAQKDGNTTTNIAGGGLSELYQGYSENVLYGLPADIIKFVAYDYLTGGKGKASVSPVEGAVYGALSTAIAQLSTTPLDVLRNRIMAVSREDHGMDENMSYVERLVKIAKEEGIEELFAGSTPRVAKAMLSGAIQFATYEETKQKIGQFFLKQ
ncbi:hypothetical protein ACHAWC_004592 [Mediolabrus comicus]